MAPDDEGGRGDDVAVVEEDDAGAGGVGAVPVGLDADDGRRCRRDHVGQAEVGLGGERVGEHVAHADPFDDALGAAGLEGAVDGEHAERHGGAEDPGRDGDEQEPSGARRPRAGGRQARDRRWGAGGPLGGLGPLPAQLGRMAPQAVVRVHGRARGRQAPRRPPATFPTRLPMLGVGPPPAVVGTRRSGRGRGRSGVGWRRDMVLRSILRACKRRTTPDWLAISAEPLPVGAAADWVVLPVCGAVVLFCGTARDHAGATGGPGLAGLRGLRGARPGQLLAASPPTCAGSGPSSAASRCCTGSARCRGRRAPWSSSSRPRTGPRPSRPPGSASTPSRRRCRSGRRRSGTASETWARSEHASTGRPGVDLMDAVVFLLVAVGVSVVGSLFLVFRHRKPPLGMDDSITEFRREMDALSPPEQRRRR